MAPLELAQPDLLLAPPELHYQPSLARQPVPQKTAALQVTIATLPVMLTLHLCLA